jgi:diacylglycerol kinase (ATP)
LKTIRTIAFIINPKSGTDRIKSIKQAILKFLPEQLFKVEIYATEFAGHATGLAKTLASTGLYETIVAVGGDGTVNEVAKGLIGSTTSLGIIPKGSGNGLARACGIPLKLEGALQVIAKGYIKNIDAGQLNQHIFLSNCGTGLDATVALACKQSEKRGLLMYINTTNSIFWKYKPLNYTINYDGSTLNTKAIMISVANGNEFGYGFKIAPTASLNDGWLDVIIIKPLNIFSAGRVSFHAWWGNLHKYSKVINLRAKSITITSENLNAYQYDGDGYETNEPMQINIIPKGLNIIAP